MSERVIGVAIGLPEPSATELRGWRHKLGDPLADLVAPHVTLVPPTEVDESEVAAIEEHLEQVAAGVESFEIRLRGTGTFRPVSPVVFVALVTGISGCERIEKAVRIGPLARTLKFNYHPHVTVAHDLPDEALDRAFIELADYQAAFDVPNFGLFERGPDGFWRTEREFTLRAP
jgi:2'-5' RNA ligase